MFSGCVFHCTCFFASDLDSLRPEFSTAIMQSPHPNRLVTISGVCRLVKEKCRTHYIFDSNSHPFKKTRLSDFFPMISLGTSVVPTQLNSTFCLPQGALMHITISQEARSEIGNAIPKLCELLQGSFEPEVGRPDWLPLVRLGRISSLGFVSLVLGCWFKEQAIKMFENNWEEKKH